MNRDAAAGRTVDDAADSPPPVDAESLRWRDAARYAVAPWAAGKCIALLVPVVFTWIDSGEAGLVPSGTAIGTLFNRWDTQSYVHIAQQGYPASTDNSVIYLDAFLPGYPLLTRLLSVFTGDVLSGGMLVSAIASFLALMVVIRLFAAERDLNSARTGAWLLALWPFSFFLSAAYTEALFLALAALTLWSARHGKRWIACIAAAAAVSVRVTGVVLVLPLIIEQVRRDGPEPRALLRRDAAFPTRAVMRTAAVGIGALCSLLPLLAYALYMRAHTGDASAFFDAQSSPSFNHHLDLPWNGFRATVATLAPDAPLYNNFIFLRELVFGLAGLVVCGVCWAVRSFPRSWAAYCTAVWLSATCISFWLSVPRYELAMFPAALLFADATRRHADVRQSVLTVCAGLAGLAAVVFTRQQWLG